MLAKFVTSLISRVLDYQARLELSQNCKILVCCWFFWGGACKLGLERLLAKAFKLRRGLTLDAVRR